MLSYSRKLEKNHFPNKSNKIPYGVKISYTLCKLPRFSLIDHLYLICILYLVEIIGIK